MIYTPIESNDFLTKINKQTNFKFDDCTYKNDECDSIHATINENSYLEIGLPNKEKKFNDFILVDEDRHILILTDKLENLIDYLNNWHPYVTNKN
jgi:hypothetical protein